MKRKIIQLTNTNTEKAQKVGCQVCIVGGGVIGLTCAITLARAGYAVRVISNQPMARTTSFAAAAFWFPVLTGSDPRVADIAASSLEMFAELARYPETGVRPIKLRVCYTDSKSADLSWCSAVKTTPVPDSELPQGCACGFDADVFRMQMEIYLPHLKEEAERLGVKFVSEHVVDLAAFPDDVVVNCTGIYAKHLIDDEQLEPIRGQVVLVSKPTATTSSKNFDVLIVEGPLPDGGERLDYVVYRDQDVLLGGTADKGDWSLTVDPEQRSAILANCGQILPELKASQFVADRIGLRPFRPTLRLGIECLPGEPVIVHAYGHGGSGVTLSWGTANLVQSMVARVAITRDAMLHTHPKPRLKAA